MDSDEILPAKKPDIVIGEDLTLLSVAELEHRIHLLEVRDRPHPRNACRANRPARQPPTHFSADRPVASRSICVKRS